MFGGTWILAFLNLGLESVIHFKTGSSVQEGPRAWLHMSNEYVKKKSKGLGPNLEPYIYDIFLESVTYVGQLIL